MTNSVTIASFSATTNPGTGLHRFYVPKLTTTLLHSSHMPCITTVMNSIAIHPTSPSSRLHTPILLPRIFLLWLCQVLPLMNSTMRYSTSPSSVVYSPLHTRSSNSCSHGLSIHGHKHFLQNSNEPYSWVLWLHHHFPPLWLLLL